MRTYSDENYESYRINNLYMPGSTALKADPAPIMTKEEYKRDLEEKNEYLAKRSKMLDIRRSRLYTFYMVFVVAATVILMSRYIDLQSAITIKLREIAKLETQIQELQADNDAIEKRLATQVPVITVKEQALSKLGMGYAKDSQIKHYSVDNVDFMSQYEELP
ncbi:MAG: hypothetical protein MJ110_05075 [Lachnospiraceae bacterium]|nr:hypothetical protein [Lachnospiraceae bacterium]